MSSPTIAWFWQPPLAGDPGFLMIRDEHPGPDHPEVPLLPEAFLVALQEVEAQLPQDIGLERLRIFARDIFGLWIELRVAPTSQGRVVKKRDPTIPDAQLEELWDQRERAGQREAYQ